MIQYLTEYNCSGFLYQKAFKALTVKQPFASLILMGKKKYEIRSWQTKYRGQLVICAAQKFHEGNVWISDKKNIAVDDFVKIFTPQIKFPLQCILALAELVDCRLMKPSDCPKSMTAFSPNLFCWHLENVTPLETQHIRGVPGIFEIRQNLIHLSNEM